MRRLTALLPAAPARRALVPALLLGAALLTACARAPAPEAPARPSRNPQVMIASAALFDPARFAGTWHVVADMAGPEARPCGITREDWRANPGGGFAVSGTRCGGGDFRGLGQLVGPGRIRLDTPGRPDLNGEPLWVLWVDADYRVAAIGTPSGRFGMILSRQPQARGDLFTAAREVMDFNGYRLDRLRIRGRN